VRFTSRAGLDTAAIAAALGAGVVEDGNGTYTLDTEPSPRLTADLATWLADHDAALVELRTTASLEETYLSLVGSDNDKPDGDPAPVRRRIRGTR
jgi:hypothetical protein